MPDGVKQSPKEQEPLWRDEFSISKADERYVSRRQLAKFLTLASLGMFAGNLWILVRGWLRKAPCTLGVRSRTWAKFPSEV